MEKLKDILETARATSNFKIFTRAVKAAGLEETLKGKGPLTVFAPTDEAFAKVPKATLDELMKPENKQKLAGLLKNHVASGKTTASMIKTMDMKTLGGATLKLKSDSRGVTVNNGRVTRGDVACSNGVIHAIDVVATGEPATSTHA